MNIQICPACHKKGIMKKLTGICSRCSKNSTKAEVTPIVVATATTAAPRPKARRKTSLERLGMRAMFGRVAR